MSMKPERNKPRMSLLPGYRALRYVVGAMHAGNMAHGYVPHSWRLADPRKFRDSLGRHVAAWLDEPQGMDSELPEVSHLALIVVNGLILLWHKDHEGPR